MRTAARCWLLLLSTLVTRDASAQTFHVERLRTEYAINPIGIDVPTPRLSWMLHADRRGTTQSAYEIRVATQERALARSPLWISGKVTSDQSVNLAYAGPALKSGQRYHCRSAHGMIAAERPSGARRPTGRRA